MTTTVVCSDCNEQVVVERLIPAHDVPADRNALRDWVLGPVEARPVTGVCPSCWDARVAEIFGDGLDDLERWLDS